MKVSNSYDDLPKEPDQQRSGEAGWSQYPPGVLALGADRGSTSSLGDRLLLDGPTATASGHTPIQISDLGGLTVGNGIEVIGASNGAITTQQRPPTRLAWPPDTSMLGPFNTVCSPPVPMAQGKLVLRSNQPSPLSQSGVPPTGSG